MSYDPETFYNLLNEQISRWAANRADLHAVIQVGSRARRDHPADRYSDADYFLVVDDNSAYLSDTTWTADFGAVVNLFHSKTAGNDDELLVMYAGGYTVDFVFPPAGALTHILQNQVPVLILQRGARILADKKRLAVQVLEIQNRLPAPDEPFPTEEAFHSNIRVFCYATIYIAKQIRRGDLVMALMRDAELKPRLISLIATHARAVYGTGRDTWHMGRYLHEWADPRALQALPAVYPTYSPEGAWKALRAGMDLFAWLARESAEKLGYSYPPEYETGVYQFLDDLENE